MVALTMPNGDHDSPTKTVANATYKEIFVPVDNTAGKVVIRPAYVVWPHGSRSETREERASTR
jgi:hypothetical protein